MSDREWTAGDEQSPAGFGAPSRRAESDIGAETPPPPPRDPAAASSPKFCPHCGGEYDPALNFCPRDGNILQLRHGEHQLVGQVLGRHYRILELLGEGGMGQVFLAEHVRIGRRCAIKVMRPALVRDSGAVGRFGREATTAGRINHRNAAAIYDFGETEEGLIYIVMEHVEGLPLSQIMAREGILPPARAVTIGMQLSDALMAAHRLGIIHRDLKPDNILIARDENGQDLVKVVDFGIAKAINDSDHSFTRTGFVVGTLQYMSPEQLIGDPLDGRSDLYSVGCILFEMLTGERTFAGPSGPAAVARRLTEPPPSPRSRNAAVPAALDDLVLRALARTPAERFQSAEELRAALKAALDAAPSETAVQGEANAAAAAAAAVPGPAPDAPVTTSPGAGGHTPPDAADHLSPREDVRTGEGPPRPAPTPNPPAQVVGAAPTEAGAESTAALGAGASAEERAPAATPAPSQTEALPAQPASAPTPLPAGRPAEAEPHLDDAARRRRRLLVGSALGLALVIAAVAGVQRWQRGAGAHARVEAPGGTRAAGSAPLGAAPPTGVGAPAATQPPPATSPSGVPAPTSTAAAAPDAPLGATEPASRVVASIRIAGTLPEGAVVLVDGTPTRSRRVLVEPGRHTVAVLAAGYMPFRWEGSLSGGDRREWTVRLEPVPAAPPRQPAASAPSAASPAPTPPRQAAPGAPTPAPQTSSPVVPAAPSAAQPAPSATSSAAADESPEGLRAAALERVRDAGAALAAAVTGRDVAALRRAWPGITPELVQRWSTFFASPDNQDVRASVLSVQPPRLQGASASAGFTVRVTFSNRVSGRMSADTRFGATLQRVPDGWQLTAIRAQP